MAVEEEEEGSFFFTTYWLLPGVSVTVFFLFRGLCRFSFMFVSNDKGLRNRKRDL